MAELESVLRDVISEQEAEMLELAEVNPNAQSNLSKVKRQYTSDLIELKNQMK